MKTQAHTRYKNKAGKQVPGVTTILGVLNKPALVKWANNLGLQGIDSTKYRDEMADIGTLAHYMIMCHLKGEYPEETDDYSAEQIDKAENCVLSFFAWEKLNPIEPILVEEPLVSEIYQYGGTLDCYARVNGELWLIDFKTGRAIYPEMLHQLAAYHHLLIEDGSLVERTQILRIGRDEDEGFEQKVVTGLKSHWEMFTLCRRIYELQKEIRRDG